MAALLAFPRDQELHTCHFTAIGAFSDLTLGFFDWEEKTYRKIPVPEQVEVLALVGDIVLDQTGKPKVHAHVVVGKADGTAHGGHLVQAHVRPTLEVILVETPRYLARTLDPESGLALINLDTPPNHSTETALTYHRGLMIRKELQMNRDTLKGQWIQLKGKIRQQWGKLTDDDLDVIQGDAEMLVGKLQEYYGRSREEAEQEFDRWLQQQKAPRKRQAA